ncbi:MAG: carboxypeptidase regulatory-like domain-containing protein, partial [Pyrinomonadaceae bacterium]|nr:carboxypeptidase regulatory-like domain-containing protein [Pyrinomonadaceae bacterium]
SAEQRAAALAREQNTPPAKSIVRGRAVYDETGRPVRRAAIMLLSTNPRGGGGEQAGLTNARGEFVLRNVRAGKYFVMVNVPGAITPISFIDLNEVRSDSFDFDEIRQHFEEVTVDGINMVNVEVRAKRGAAISGRVSYADGDPAINVQIALMRKKDSRTARFLSNNIGAAMLLGMRTDDRGMFRVTGLPPGDYYVSASEPVVHGDAGDGQSIAVPSMGMVMGGMGAGDSLVDTYYKDATSEKEASVIHVELGQEASDINFTLIERPTYRLRGVVRAKRGGRPVARARINIERKDVAPTFNPFTQESGVAQTDEQGRFSLNEIPDGTYTLTVEPPYDYGGGEGSDSEYMSGNMNMNTNTSRIPEGTAVVTATRPREPRFVRKQQEVKVAGAEQTNIIVELAQGGSIAGTVVMENGTPLPRTANIVVKAELVGAQEPLEGSSGGDYVAPGNNQFTIESLPVGSFYLNAYVPAGEEGTGNKYYVKSIILNSSDLTRDPITLQEGQTITGVRVVLAADAATLTGRVVASGEDKRPLSNRIALVVPAEATKRRRRSTQHYERTDGEGAFTLNLPPGEYLIILLPKGTGGAGALLSEEAINQSAANTVTRVTLGSNERKNVDITASGEN